MNTNQMASELLNLFNARLNDDNSQWDLNRVAELVIQLICHHENTINAHEQRLRRNNIN